MVPADTLAETVLELVVFAAAGAAVTEAEPADVESTAPADDDEEVALAAAAGAVERALPLSTAPPLTSAGFATVVVAVVVAVAAISAPPIAFT